MDDNWRQRNWNRWGSDDDKGTLNLISPEKVKAALRVVTKGRVASLGVPLGKHTPVSPGRPRPVHTMLRDGADFAIGLPTVAGQVESADDYLTMATQTGTHLDALAHLWRSEFLFNGVPRREVRSSGAHRLDIRSARGIVTRAVVFDVPQYLDRQLEAGEQITDEMLEGIDSTQGLSTSAGDAALVHTGWLRREREMGDEWYERQPGIDLSSAKWLAERDVALVAADNLAVECKPWDPNGEGLVPVHVMLIRECGIHLLELADFTPLIEAGVTECLFVAAPLPIVGGVGSPLDPVAIW